MRVRGVHGQRLGWWDGLSSAEVVTRTRVRSGSVGWSGSRAPAPWCTPACTIASTTSPSSGRRTTPIHDRDRPARPVDHDDLAGP